MKFNKSYFEDNGPYKLILLIAVTIIITVAAYNYIDNRRRDQISLHFQSDIIDTSALGKNSGKDSVQLANEKVSSLDFDVAYSAEKWFSDFKSNKVAFDKDFNEKAIDLHGTITEITNNNHCPAIKISVDDNPFDEINCSNCADENSGWINEVIGTSVGQEVHIRGYYSGLTSASYRMDVYGCRIIKD